MAKIGSSLICGLLLLTGCLTRQAELSPDDFGVAFRDVSADVGIDYVGTSYGSAWGDFDGDGLPDLWASGHAPLHLFASQPDGTFRNVSDGVVRIRGDRHGAAWADLDGDGDEDLIQLTGGGRGKGVGANYLLINSEGRLRDRASQWGVVLERGRGRTPAWLDFDADGRLDLLIANGRREDAPSVLLRQGDRVLEEADPSVGFDHRADAVYTQLAHLDATPTLYVFVGSQAQPSLYRIEQGEFRNVTRERGIPRGRTTDSVIADFDNDLDQDLFAIDGGLDADVELRAEGELLLRLRAQAEAKELRFKSDDAVSFDLGPFNSRWWTAEHVFIGARGAHPTSMPFTLDATSSDAIGLAEIGGEVDKALYIGFDPERSVWRVRIWSREGERVNGTISSDRIWDVERVGFEGYRATEPARLYVNEGGVFVERGAELGLGGPINCFSAVAGDFDNDMDIDLYLVCGTWTSNSPNRLLENTGAGSFRVVEAAAGASGSREGLGDSVSLVDYDADGFLDLFVTNGAEQPPFSNGPFQLLRNLGNGNHWLEIDLKGVVSNRNAIGARVVVEAGGVSQVRSQGNGMHNKVQDHRRLHFGLGSHAAVDRLRIEWPSGEVQTLEGIAADRVLTVVEPRSSPSQ